LSWSSRSGVGGLLSELERGRSGLLTDEQFAMAIRRLGSHRATEQTMQQARQVAGEAVNSLAGLPRGIVYEALERFAERVVGRTS
jgi:hypothetical protein